MGGLSNSALTHGANENVEKEFITGNFCEGSMHSERRIDDVVSHFVGGLESHLGAVFALLAFPCCRSPVANTNLRFYRGRLVLTCFICSSLWALLVRRISLESQWCGGAVLARPSIDGSHQKQL